MFRRLKRAFVPHEGNDFYPQFKKPQVLAVVTVALLGVQIALNLGFSTSPKILGFATDITVEDLIRSTNEERVNGGMKALRVNEELSRAARLKAEYMFENDFWAHVAPDGTTPWHFFELVDYDYYFAGENLARDFNTSGGVVRAWMDSSSHRDNIMNSNFTEIGMVAVNGTLNGEETTLVVQLFGSPLAPVVASSEAESGTSGAAALEGIAGEARETLPESQPTLTAYGLEVEIPAEEITKPAGVQFELARPSLAAIKDLGPTQRVYLPLLSLLMFLFVLDSFVLLRRRQIRVSGHSMLHAIGIGIGMAAMMLIETGQVL